MNDEEKTRADKIRETVTAKYEAGYQNPFAGKHHNDESKKRMSESQKGKHSAPRKKRSPETITKVRSETTPKPVAKTQPTSPIHCFSHRIKCTKDPFYIGFGNDPYDTTCMSDIWHAVADGNEWIAAILDSDIDERDIKPLEAYYVDYYAPEVNLKELLLVSDDEDEFVPFGQEDDDVPKESYINGLGFVVEPPGTEQAAPDKTFDPGTWKDENGVEHETWVDNTPRTPTHKKIAPQATPEQQLEAMRQAYKRTLDADIDEDEDCSGRETFVDV